MPFSREPDPTQVEFSFVVAAEDAGLRVDAAVRQAFPASRALLLSRFSSGQILLNGRHCSKGDRVNADDRVDVLKAAESEASQQPPPQLDVRYETEALLVCYKPPGVASVALAHSELPALSDALLLKYPALRDVGYQPGEAGLLQRLDNDTSGLILAAKSGASFQRLLDGIQEGELSKRYLALVHTAPSPASGDIRLGLAPHPKNRRKVAVAAGTRGHAAVTTYRLLTQCKTLALVELEVETAYRHQIRVHLAALGSPLVGDTLYGGETVPELRRHALHASRLTWKGGKGIAAFDIQAALPDDLRRVAEQHGLTLPPDV